MFKSPLPPSFIAIPLTLLVAGLGCTPAIPVGNGGTVSQNGNQTTVTGADGSKVTIDQGSQQMHMQSANGVVDMKGGVVTETDNKGNSSQFGGDVTEADLGYPFYPGSLAGTGSMKASSPQGKTTVSVRTTTDSPAQVVAFYKSKAGNPSTETTLPNGAAAVWDKASPKLNLIISQSDGKTMIDVTTTTSPK